MQIITHAVHELGATGKQHSTTQNEQKITGDGADKRLLIRWQRLHRYYCSIAEPICACKCMGSILRKRKMKIDSVLIAPVVAFRQ